MLHSWLSVNHVIYWSLGTRKVFIYMEQHLDIANHLTRDASAKIHYLLHVFFKPIISWKISKDSMSMKTCSVTWEIKAKKWNIFISVIWNESIDSNSASKNVRNYPLVYWPDPGASRSQVSNTAHSAVSNSIQGQGGHAKEQQCELR